MQINLESLQPRQVEFVTASFSRTCVQSRLLNTSKWLWLIVRRSLSTPTTWLWDGLRNRSSDNAGEAISYKARSGRQKNSVIMHGYFCSYSIWRGANGRNVSNRISLPFTIVILLVKPHSFSPPPLSLMQHDMYSFLWKKERHDSWRKAIFTCFLRFIPKKNRVLLSVYKNKENQLV